MLRNWILIVAGVALMAGSGCALEGNLSSKATHLESCFSTGYSVSCVATPQGPALDGRDVNGDGIRDIFLCADMESDSDSVSSESDGEEGESDGDRISDSDSESDAAECEADSDSDSTSDSDSDADGDGDGVPDKIDCDCFDPGGDPDPDPEGGDTKVP